MNPFRFSSRLKFWGQNRLPASCAAVALLFVVDGLGTHYHLATHEHLPAFNIQGHSQELAIWTLDREDHEHDSSHHPHPRLDHAPQSLNTPKAHFVQVDVALQDTTPTIPLPHPDLLPLAAPPFEARGSPPPSPRQPRAPPVT